MSLSTFSLDGRRALVTGGSRGLGAAMASGLASAGARVALVARGEQELHDTAVQIGELASCVVANVVADESGLRDLVDRAELAVGGPIDIVVHAAGTQHRARAESFDPVEWQRVIEVNLTAPYALSREIGRRQLEGARTGSHIFIGSITSQLAVPEVVAYTASKSGVWGVLRNLSLEWASRGIRVNGIGPGYVRTHLTEALFADEDRVRRLMDRIPMQRLGRPEDMAGAAIFLASDASAYVTGQLLMVDGGWTSS
jgi:NAD(P)-dependent dehydrogenase (short-subunit alcohol dehydrogenase family)